MPLLEVRGVTKTFGGVVANSDVSLNVSEWEIVGLIGPNGAGKTTLFNCITGVFPANRGTIEFLGEDITKSKTHERAKLGIGRSFQNLGLVRGVSVLQNLITAQHMTIGYNILEGMVGAPLSFEVEEELIERADRILKFTQLGEFRDSSVDDLPYGILKKVELATVLSTDPQLLLLDEPSSGLSPTESEELGDILLRLREELGVTILMIEHHVPLVVKVCDYVYVLNFGELLTEGLPQDIRQHPGVIAAYLGGDFDEETGELAEPLGVKPTPKRVSPVKPAAEEEPEGQLEYLEELETPTELLEYVSPEGLSEYVPYGGKPRRRRASKQKKVAVKPVREKVPAVSVPVQEPKHEEQLEYQEVQVPEAPAEPLEYVSPGGLSEYVPYGGTSKKGSRKRGSR